MGKCGQPSIEEADKKRYKTLASQLPLIRGTIIRSDGTLVDIPDLVGGIEKTPMDPQLARAQNIMPFIRDTVILDKGQTCSLEEILTGLLSRSLVYSRETRFIRIGLMPSDWGEEETGEFIPNITDLQFYYYQLIEGDWAWQ